MPVSISIGILCAVWFQITVMVPWLIAWVGVFCFVMTMEGNIPLLSAIPGQFVGAAVFFGNLDGHNGDIVATLINTLVCMLIGNLFGILSAKLPDLFKREQSAAEA